MPRKKRTKVGAVKAAFQPDTLKALCEADETDFIGMYDMEWIPVMQAFPADFYCFKDNGADILAVAHLDTVARAERRTCAFLETAAGTVVYSRALDDRLGAYTILELLPALGIKVDVLLTVGEEIGKSTAAFFDVPDGKQYKWIIEFDRGGTDVVMYQYEDPHTTDLVEASGARVGDGIFSDIGELEHLGVKAFNWGIGYRDYHSARAHAYLDDTFMMVAQFVKFYEANAGTHLPHLSSSRAYAAGWDDDDIALMADEWRDLYGFARVDSDLDGWAENDESSVHDPFHVGDDRHAAHYLRDTGS